jgi:hypothetical protein
MIYYLQLFLIDYLYNIFTTQNIYESIFGKVAQKNNCVHV